MLRVHPNQLIAAPVYCNDVSGSVGAGLELRPQLGDVVVHRARDGELVVAPDVAEQLLAADDFIAMGDQIAQQLELARRERDPPSPPRDETLPQRRDVAEDELVAGGQCQSSRRTCARTRASSSLTLNGLLT